MKGIAVLLSVGATFVVLAAPLVAQTPVRANVPFEFQVAERTLPSGEYKLAPLSAFRNNDIQIVGKDGTVLALTYYGGTPASLDAGKVKLVFHRYGSRYFLAEIVDGYMKVISKLPQSKQERELLAALAGRDETVTILARL